MNLKTTLHCETFNLLINVERAAYDALNARLTEAGMKRVVFGHMAGASDPKGAAYRNKLHTLNGREIELETDFIFDDQWNTAPIDGSETGLRVFDWQDTAIFDVKHVRTVQWLDITPEMRAIRLNILKCGYCGAHYPLAEAPLDRFCTKCIDSECLKAEDLHLLRLCPAGTSFGAQRDPLSEAERERLLPIYRHAQLHGATERGKARIAKAKADVEERYTRTVEKARIERDGRRWLLEHVPAVDGNAIYYSHTGRWGFGWREPVGGALLDDLLEAIAEFPFPYDIKTADRGTLSGEH